MVAFLEVSQGQEIELPVRPRFWKHLGFQEILAFAALMLVYEWLRDLVAPTSTVLPVAHAQSVISAERGLGLLLEPSLQRHVNDIPGGQSLVSWLYTLGHTPGFIVFFVWLWWRHRDQFSFVRTWFWLSHAVAVVVFWWWPLAPPRFSGLGMEDPTEQTLRLGGATSWFQPFRNLYAAMPSLHVGYTVLYAIVITLIGVSSWRFAAWIWPAAMLVVVMATANHYWLDGVGGALTIGAGCSLALLANRVTGAGMRKPWERAA